MEQTKNYFTLSENMRNAAIVAVLFFFIALLSYLEWRGVKLF